MGILLHMCFQYPGFESNTLFTVSLLSDKQKREEQQQATGSGSTGAVKEPLNAADVYSSNSEQESSSSSGSESEGGESEDEAGGR